MQRHGFGLGPTDLPARQRASGRVGTLQIIVCVPVLCLVDLFPFSLCFFQRVVPAPVSILRCIVVGGLFGCAIAAPASSASLCDSRAPILLSGLDLETRQVLAEERLRMRRPIALNVSTRACVKLFCSITFSRCDPVAGTRQYEPRAPKSHRKEPQDTIVQTCRKMTSYELDI